LGKACLLKGDYETALKHLQKSIDIEPQNSTALLALGEIYLEKKDGPKAEDYINKALKIYNKLKNAHLFLGRLEENRGNNSKALEHFKKELEYNPANYIAAYHLAELLKKENRYPEAISYYRQVIAGDPGFRLPYFMIANYFMETGQNFEEAIDLCKKGIQITPHDQATLFGYFILTNIYGKMGDQTNFKFYSAEGEKLYKTLQQEQGN
jgi:tetratricopeptide (TPR) repeat protein